MIIEINGYSSEGDGVARLDDGRVAFVPNGVRGDVCRVIITKNEKRFCRAKIVEIVTPSEHRVKPNCVHFGKCGGCDFRHITREEELYAKRTRVNDALTRIGGFNLGVNEVLTANDDGYRNKIMLAINYKTENTTVGLYREGSRDILEIDRCPLAVGAINAAIGMVKQKVKRYDASKGIPESVIIRKDTHGAAARLIKRDGNRMELLGKGSVEIKMGNFIFKSAMESFFQINTEAAVVLYDKVKEFASLEKNEVLLDLYCGTGTIALYLAAEAKQVIGIDIDLGAIEDAKENAAINGIENARFIAADAASPEISDKTIDCVVVDPPRGGLNKETIEQIIKANPLRVVYVSCDPANLARDMKLFEGYTPTKICAIDMFPKTAHIETVSLLEKNT